ncbi:MAG: Hpt domain-containing protein [Dongiaceae bacterium]
MMDPSKADEPVAPELPDRADDGGGIDYQPLGDALAAAEAATAEMRSTYTVWARADLDRAQAALDAAAQDPLRQREHVNQLYALMHNVKGQGASFDYPLVTRIGQSLCQIAHPQREIGDDVLKVAQAHLDALKMILDQRISGPAGGIAERLATKLESLASGVRR